jgi:cytochrome oxidase Cu insertion factor (SCO1/SenC/PrrC family)
VWRWGAFVVLPFLVALTTAMAVTAYVDAGGQLAAATPSETPPGPQGAPTLERMMNLSPLPERAAPGFTLTDQHGRRVSLAGFRGKAVLLGFLDSRCTQVCPVIAQELIAADHDLGPRASSVVLVGVNVNPAAESVAAVEHFSVIHGLSRLPNWHFLTGSTHQLARVWKAYGIGVELPQRASQTVHSDYLFFINPLGHERFLAEPFADRGRNGTGYLPAATVQQFGRGIARYLGQAASG